MRGWVRLAAVVVVSAGVGAAATVAVTHLGDSDAPDGRLVEAVRHRADLLTHDTAIGALLSFRCVTLSGQRISCRARYSGSRHPGEWVAWADRFGDVQVRQLSYPA